MGQRQGPDGEGASTAAVVDPGSNLRFGGDARRLRGLLRDDVTDLQRQATGRVLDLRGPLAGGFAYGPLNDLVVAPVSSLGGRALEPFDTICSFGAMAEAARPAPFVAALRRLLAPDGRLLFVELDGDARRWRRGLDFVARRLWGLSMAHNVTGALWAGGFEVTTLDRRPVRHGPPGLLRSVVGAARPNPHLPEPAGGAPTEDSMPKMDPS